MMWSINTSGQRIAIQSGKSPTAGCCCITKTLTLKTTSIKPTQDYTKGRSNIPSVGTGQNMDLPTRERMVPGWCGLQGRGVECVRGLRGTP